MTHLSKFAAAIEAVLDEAALEVKGSPSVNDGAGFLLGIPCQFGIGFTLAGSLETAVDDAVKHLYESIT